MKEILGISAMLLALVSYVPYLRNVVRGRTRPHAFSWLIWGTMTGIGFAAQVVDGGGPGAWVNGFTAAASAVIFTVAVFYGEKDITRSDWLCLAGAGAAGVMWAATNDPLLSVVIITIIDALGFLPTFRKSYHRPFEETQVTYAMSAIKFVISLFALSNVSVVTALYPASLILMNGLFVAMVAVRRRQLLAA